MILVTYKIVVHPTAAFSAERRARDEPLPDELMNRDFAAEPGFAATYAAQLDKAVAAWSDSAAWERELAVGFVRESRPHLFVTVDRTQRTDDVDVRQF